MEHIDHFKVAWMLAGTFFALLVAVLIYALRDVKKIEWRRDAQDEHTEVYNVDQRRPIEPFK